MTRLKKVLVLVIILVGLGVLSVILIKIYFPEASQGNPDVSSSPAQEHSDKQKLSSTQLIEQIVLANLKTRTLDEALAKFKRLTGEDRNKFIENFLAELDVEVIKELLGEGKEIALLKTLPADHQRFITQMLSEISGLSPKVILYLDNFGCLSTMLGLKEPTVYEPVPISFATRVNKDNSTQNNRPIFKPEEYRIYACFATKSGLKELRFIRIKWTNLTNGDITYQGYKLIDPSKSYNYVWIKNNRNWKAGKYEVRIFNLRNTCLARGNYEVR